MTEGESPSSGDDTWSEIGAHFFQSNRGEKLMNAHVRHSHNGSRGITQNTKTQVQKCPTLKTMNGTLWVKTSKMSRRRLGKSPAQFQFLENQR